MDWMECPWNVLAGSILKFSKGKPIHVKSKAGIFRKIAQVQISDTSVLFSSNSFQQLFPQQICAFLRWQLAQSLHKSRELCGKPCKSRRYTRAATDAGICNNHRTTSINNVQEPAGDLFSLLLNTVRLQKNISPLMWHAETGEVLPSCSSPSLTSDIEFTLLSCRLLSCSGKQ